MKDSILKITIAITDKFKPIIIKLIPIEILRKAKKNIITSYTNSKNYGRIAFERDVYDDGINLVGALKAEIGLGQSCRLLAKAISKTKMPYVLYNYRITNSVPQKETELDDKISQDIKYNINLLHINPYDLPLASATLGKEFFERRYNIGYWLWELENFPKEWELCFKYVDEIWTPAEFVSEAIRKSTKLPVKTIPYAIETKHEENMNREYFGLPKDKFLFLTMFDSNSTMERKNPIGAIKAFKKAFESQDDSVGLIIKINNAQKKDIEQVKQMLEGYKNIFIIDKILNKVEVDSLIKQSNVLVSMHRAEGYGLPIAEAMLLGTPTIATAWSANMEFCSKETNCLVEYELVEIEEDCAMYKKGNRWAEPNVSNAAEHMIKLRNDKEYYENISKNARLYISENLCDDKIVKLIEARVDEILESV